ncbi:MAG: RimK family alpha-L-glutamate ligase [candidate division Zixibacteria bacterium]|nr:RimK family alpha-L-glutamate ligase [candidate division Zixibacteria bacterium]
MANIGVFIERYTLTRSEEVGALMKLGQVAHMQGHRLDFLFRPDMYKIPHYDAIFIRALTDPLNSTYVASRLAQLNGLRVIDDPDSIIICCDKVNMYRHLQQAGVPMPETVFLKEADLTVENGAKLLDSMGNPLVLKAPNSSFSLYVERVYSPEEFVKVGKRFLRRADRVVAQRFIQSEFDWRVGVLAGEALYVCQYVIPKKRWKITTYTGNGREISGNVKGFDLTSVNPKLIETAVRAAKAIGNGLYGIDLKQVGDEFVVIEVNDNPTIAEDEEDQKAPYIYEKLIRYLVGEWGN